MEKIFFSITDKILSISVADLITAGIIFTLCLGIQVFLSRLAEKELKNKYEKYIPIGKNSAGVAAALIFMFFTAFFQSYKIKVASSIDFTTLVFNLGGVWAVYYLVRLFHLQRLAQLGIFVLSIIIVALNFVDLLIPFIDVLKNFSISFGKYNISLVSVAKSILSFIILVWIVKKLSSYLNLLLINYTQLNNNDRSVVLKVSNIGLFFMGGLFFLNIVGIDMTSFTVLSGAVGVGIGFGLQKIAANFISGLILVFEKSIRVDDYVQLADGTEGFVKKFGGRYALIETLQKTEMLIPNEELITSKVTNWTYSNKSVRLDIDVGVSYSSDLRLVHKLILEAASEHPRCSKKIQPECYLMEYGDSSVNFLLYFWIEDMTKGRYQPRSEIMFAIWDKFKENNVEIPFPQRDIHIKTGSSLH